MTYFLRKKKAVTECDGACVAPLVDVADGMGTVVPCASGDRFDNVLGAGFVNTNTFLKTAKKQYKVRKRKNKK